MSEEKVVEVVISVRIPGELRDKLKEKATKEDRNMAQGYVALCAYM